jgi:membrane protease YdiL (CAAX protease family)
MKTKSRLAGVLGIWAGACVAVFLFGRMAQGAAPWNQIGALGTPVLFLYGPFVLAIIGKRSAASWGLTLGDPWNGTRLALGTAAIVLPVFVLGYYVFWGWFVGRTIIPFSGDALLSTGIWALVGIALPEEVFFRGWMQSRLGEFYDGGVKILGAKIGPAILISSALFTLTHLVTNPDPIRLAVFFPSLIFGWLRARTGSVLAPVLFHWLADLAVILLEGSI